MRLLLIAEHNQTQLKASSYACLSAALKFNIDIDLVIVGYQCQAVLKEASELAGLQQIYYADNPAYEHILAETLSPLLLDITNTQIYTHILAPDTTFGRNFLPRLAAKLGVEQISDVVQILNSDTFVRPIYAGNALNTIQSNDAIKLLTIRSTAFAAELLRYPAIRFYYDTYYSYRKGLYYF